MQLFSDSSFFIWLVVLTIPAFILGILEKRLQWYGLAVSLLFIWFAMGAKPIALVYLGVFCVYQCVLTQGYLVLRKKYKRDKFQYYLFLTLALMPLIINKVLGVTGNEHHIFGFLGISYLTFKAVQTVIEIYDGVIKEMPVVPFLYCLVFFPAITSGPIDRTRRFREDAERVWKREEYLEMAGEGLRRIFTGAVMKIVLAGGLYIAVSLLEKNHSGTATLIYMYAYGFYLYFDFAGYSSMAIGASYLFGIKTPENFKHPFVSKDINEFWNRWHITLSHWLRDFLFSRITMHLIRGKAFNKNRLAIASTSFMINMTVMGIWHGLTPNFIIYGMYHGVLLTLHEIIQSKWGFYKTHKNDRWFQVVEWVINFHLVMIGFLIFSNKGAHFFRNL